MAHDTQFDVRRPSWSTPVYIAGYDARNYRSPRDGAVSLAHDYYEMLRGFQDKVAEIAIIMEAAAVTPQAISEYAVFSGIKKELERGIALFPSISQFEHDIYNNDTLQSFPYVYDDFLGGKAPFFGPKDLMGLAREILDLETVDAVRWFTIHAVYADFHILVDELFEASFSRARDQATPQWRTDCAVSCLVEETFNAAANAWTDLARVITEEENRSMIKHVLQYSDQLFPICFSSSNEIHSLGYLDDFEIEDEQMILENAVLRLKSQWLIWKYMLPDWQFSDDDDYNYINKRAWYNWLKTFTGLPEGFNRPSFKRESKAKTYLRLLLASAMNSTLLDYDLVVNVAYLTVKEPYTLPVPRDEPLDPSFEPPENIEVVYGLAMALITKIKRAILIGQQLSLLDGLTILRGFQLTQSIRAPAPLATDWRTNITTVKPLLTDACLRQSLVLRAIHTSVYSSDAREPSEILHYLVLRHNIPRVGLDYGNNLILLGDALGFVVLTRRISKDPGNWAVLGRIVLLQDKIKITRDGKGNHGFVVANVHEEYGGEFRIYCWKTGPLDTAQEGVLLLVKMRDRKVFADQAILLCSGRMDDIDSGVGWSNIRG